MNKRTKYLLGIGIIATLIVGWQVAAFAVHDLGVFELEGDATNNPAVAGDDWDNVCHQVTITQDPDPPNAIPNECASASNTTGATAVDWVAELNNNASIFTGGGSKDPNDISQWAWKDGAGGLPNKDNLQHSFAARYTAGGQDLLYFGSDRIENSGSSQQGFWFFQNTIGLNGPPVGGATGFTGVHKNGDVLVLTDFSNGGTTSTITVYAWDTRCTKAGTFDVNNTPGNPNDDITCGDANLLLKGTAANAKCSTQLTNDNFCGIVNPTDGTVAPWSFTDTAGNHTYLQGEFFEGGINLTALGLGGKCFASVASESRSSGSSTTAQLKDFVLGGFGQCGSSVATQSTPTGSTEIPANGVVPVSDTATVTVTGASTWAGNVQFYLCGPDLANPPTISTCAQTDGNKIGSPVPVSNTGTGLPGPTATSPGTNTVTSAGKYCWSAKFTPTSPSDLTGASDTGANECFTVNPVTPTLPTTAGADKNLGEAVTDTANLTGTANQPGSPVINPTTAGDPAGGTITFTLYKADCTTKATSTVVGETNPQTVNVSGDGSYGPVSFTPDAPGTYHWVASYSGNLPNTNGTSHNTTCNDANEDVVVSKSEVKTTPKTADDPPNNGIPPGGLSIGTGSVQAKDSATVTVTGTNTWDGNVKFFLCANSTSGCASGAGTQIGGDVPVSNSNSTVLSDAATITAAGDYCWRAEFTATTPGVPNSSDGSDGECFTVNPVTPTLTTEASADVDLGNPVSDTATLSGTANQPGTPVINPTTPGGPAGGKITFNLYGPDDADCSGDPVYTKEVDVSGDADNYNSGEFTPTEPGTYRWVATYSGDLPNTNGTVTACDDADEDVVVNQVQASMTSKQSFIPNDEATVTAPAGGDLDGSVKFELFESNDCSGTAIYTEDNVPVSGPSTGVTVHTTNTTVSTTAANVSWRLTYTSNKQSQKSIEANCLEKTELIIDNGGTIPPPPSP